MNYMDIENIKKEQGLSGEDLSDAELDNLIDSKIQNDLEPERDEEKGDGETPAEPSTEKKPNEDDSPSSQGEKDENGDEEEKPIESKNTDDGEEKKQVPFHKHPRFRNIISSNKQLKSENKTLNDRLIKLENPKKEEKIPSVPDWFAGNKNDWETYNNNQKERDERIISEAVKASGGDKVKKEEELKKVEVWIDEQIDELEDDPDIKPFKRNELLKVMKDYSCTDESGNLDFKKGYKLMLNLYPKEEKETKEEKEKKEALNIKKKIISTDNPSNNNGDNSNNIITADDIRHKSWS